MKRIGLIAVLVWLFSPLQPSLAHMIWLNIADDRPAVGEPMEIEIGWGHHFPDGGPLKDGFLNQIRAQTPSGKEIKIDCQSSKKCSFTPPEAGRYNLLVDIHPGFVTKTTQGYQMKPKTGIEGALTCFRYDIRAKASVVAGKAGAGQEKPAGDLLEILALSDPTALAPGDDLLLQVIYEGNPLAGAKLQATYEGFSDKPNQFAIEKITDDQGKATIHVEKPGSWLVTLTHTLPYPDTGVCDETRYKYSLTFQVKPSGGN